MKIESIAIIGRRQFIKGATIIGGLAALLRIVKPAAAGPKESQHQPEQLARGYRLTEHVRKYYETARL